MSISLPVVVLKKYLRQVFIETGTFKGGGIDVAKKAGAQRIISIEVHEPYWKTQADRFASDPSVMVCLGDSGSILEEIIKDIDESIVFWLDGHIHLDGKGEKNTPILDELSQIGRHKRRDHVILIDDRSAMGGPLWGGVTEQHVIDAILAINPEYRFIHEDSLTIKNEILVAVAS